MPTLRLSREARAAIRAEARSPFYDTAKNVAPDGSADVPFEQETIDRLDLLRFEGESYSDLLIRVCSTYNKPKN
jgi:hypothetical protein